jgi:hypothetical protein
MVPDFTSSPSWMMAERSRRCDARNRVAAQRGDYRVDIFKQLFKQLVRRASQ